MSKNNFISTVILGILLIPVCYYWTEEPNLEFQSSISSNVQINENMKFDNSVKNELIGESIIFSKTPKIVQDKSIAQIQDQETADLTAYQN